MAVMSKADTIYLKIPVLRIHELRVYCKNESTHVWTAGQCAFSHDHKSCDVFKRMAKLIPVENLVLALLDTTHLNVEARIQIQKMLELKGVLDA